MQKHHPFSVNEEASSSLRQRGDEIPAKHEEHRAEQAQSRPEIVELEGLLQVENREGYEKRQRDHLLQHLELPHVHHAVADAVRRDLEEVFEEGDAPAEERRDDPGPVPHLLEVGIPGEGHEKVAQAKQADKGQVGIHARRRPEWIGGSPAQRKCVLDTANGTCHGSRMMRMLSTLLLALYCAAAASLSAAPPMTLSPEIREKALAILRGALRLEDPEQFWVAMHAAEGLVLGGYGEEIVPVLEPRLATEKDGQRLCGLARELVRAGRKEHVAVLAEVLRREDSYGHTHAAESLYKVDELGDEATMRQRFQQGGDIKLRLMAAGALARKGDTEALAFIRGSRDGDDPDGLQIAAWLLGILGDRSDIEPLRKRIADAPTPLIRAYVEHALACLGDPEGLARLARNLEDGDDLIRTYAATFAGDAKAVSTQARLEAMLDDPFHDARVRAAQTLVQLSRTAP